jgi:two-component system, NarL family, response regulator NreC
MRDHPHGGHSDAMGESSPRPENEGSAPSKAHHPLAIVLAADAAAVRPKLRRLLEGAPGLEIVAEAGNAESAVEAVVRHAPAALVLDLDRPGDIASLDTIGAVQQASPATRVIVLVTKDDARFAHHALHAGAAACILGDPPGEDVVDAVRRAAAERLAPAQPEPPPDDLTGRELDVLRLLALGHTNSEIAAQLHLSVRTIEGHRAHLQQKLSRPSRAELVRYALDRGLLGGTEDPAQG